LKTIEDGLTPRHVELHIVKEARAQGWDTLSNGDLLKAAEEAGFEGLLTTTQICLTNQI